MLSASRLARAGGAQDAVCGTCLAISVAAEAAAALPPQLDGLDVFVRVGPGREVRPSTRSAKSRAKADGRVLSLEGFAQAVPPAALLGRHDGFWPSLRPCLLNKVLKRLPSG